MIFGAHVLLYSENPDADRAFFRDVLGFHNVDAGEGWLIFALPPAEAAFHPSDSHSGQGHAGRELLGAVLYLMCVVLAAAIKSLQAKKVVCFPVEKARWGSSTFFRLPWREYWPLSARAPHGHQESWVNRGGRPSASLAESHNFRKETGRLSNHATAGEEIWRAGSSLLWPADR